jgi:hypothetical protein
MRAMTHLLASSSLVSLVLLSAGARAQDAPVEAPPSQPVPPPAPAPPPPSFAQAPVVLQPPPASVQGAPYLSRRDLRHWRDGDPIPPGYHPEQKTRDGLAIAGGILFAVPYFFSAVVAVSSHNQADQSLYAPVIGPFLRIGNNDANSNVADIVADVFLAMDGLAQTAGVTMLVIGTTTTKTVLVRNDLASMPVVVPMRFGNDGYGLGLAARF